MPRTRKRTTDNRSYSIEVLRDAVRKVVEERLSVRNVSKALGIPRRTLTRYVRKANELGIENVNFGPKIEHLKVFSNDEELLIVDYIKHASNIHYGLTNAAARNLAYEFASINRIECPESWNSNKCAGKEWLYSMMRRHNFSFRSPEQTSMARATSFNQANVNLFYENLKSSKEKYKFAPQDVYNMDETACTTVHKPPKVISIRGKKNVGQITSAERGVLVTCLACIGSTGKAVPPFFVFRRVNFQDHFMNGSPPGSKGVASRTGWMVTELFLSVLEHFAAHERPSKENPKLIVMDNHESQLSVADINFARNNGPFKKFYNSACDNWLVNNPGKVITIYDIAGLVGKAWPMAFTPLNICHGFKKTGIEPFDPDIFSPEDFLSAFVTDRPNPIDIDPMKQTSFQNTVFTDDSPGPSTLEESPTTSQSLKLIAPQEIKPHPKAPPRISKPKWQKAKSVELTSTPEEDKLIEKAWKRQEKMRKQEEAKERKVMKSLESKLSFRRNLTEVEESKEKQGTVALKSKINSKRKHVEEEYSSEESEDDISLYSDTSLEMRAEETIDDFSEDKPTKLKIGVFVLVKIAGKTKLSYRYYVGEVNETMGDELNLVFYKKVSGLQKFIRTDETAFVHKNDVVLILPTPTNHRSGRFENMVTFSVDLFSSFSPIY